MVTKCYGLTAVHAGEIVAVVTQDAFSGDIIFASENVSNHQPLTIFILQSQFRTVNCYKNGLQLCYFITLGNKLPYALRVPEFFASFLNITCLHSKKTFMSSRPRRKCRWILM